MQTTNTQNIYLSFYGHFNIKAEKDCPFTLATDEKVKQQLNEVFPHSGYFYIEKQHFNKLISYLKKYLNQFNTPLCCLYCPNEDFSISESQIYNLFEEAPTQVQPGEYLTLGYIMSEQRVFLKKSYQAEGQDIHLLALEKRENDEQLLLAFPFRTEPCLEHEPSTIREIKKQELWGDESLFHYHMPESITIDGREIEFVERHTGHFTAEHKDDRAWALYEYLLKQNALPENLKECPFVFCFCKTKGRTIDSLDFQHMVLHFPPQKKTCLVEQSFHLSINDGEQTLRFSTDDKEACIYLATLRLIDIYEGHPEEHREHLQKFISEEQRLLVVAYEISDETVHPMFYRKELLDNPPKHSDSGSATGWFVSPEWGTVGSHGLPLHYAFIEIVSEQFDEEMEIELFDVQIDVAKKEDVEIV